jgi:diaminopimelate decarboxylase
VTSTLSTPTHNFAGTDSGMNHLIRPALYESYHHIINASALDESEKKPYIITGNICESGDIIGKDRELNIKSGDILAILDVGAYGYSMVKKK